jgi:hypothetical protein
VFECERIFETETQCQAHIDRVHRTVRPGFKQLPGDDDDSGPNDEDDGDSAADGSEDSGTVERDDDERQQQSPGLARGKRKSCSGGQMGRKAKRVCGSARQSRSSSSKRIRLGSPSPRRQSAKCLGGPGPERQSVRRLGKRPAATGPKHPSDLAEGTGATKNMVSGSPGSLLLYSSAVSSPLPEPLRFESPKRKVPTKGR